MKQYTLTKYNFLSIDGKEIPQVAGNSDYDRYLIEIRDGTAEILPYIAPPDTRSYRDKRLERYTSDLSVEGTRDNSIGDAIDALIDAHYGDSAKLDSLKVIIDRIKSDIPKV